MAVQDDFVSRMACVEQATKALQDRWPDADVIADGERVVAYDHAGRQLDSMPAPQPRVAHAENAVDGMTVRVLPYHDLPPI
jgi:hypothetical protein